MWMDQQLFPEKELVRRCGLRFFRVRFCFFFALMLILVHGVFRDMSRVCVCVFAYVFMSNGVYNSQDRARQEISETIERCPSQCVFVNVCARSCTVRCNFVLRHKGQDLKDQREDDITNETRDDTKGEDEKLEKRQMKDEMSGAM